MSEAEGEGEADNEAFAAREVAGGAHGVGLVAVDDVEGEGLVHHVAQIDLCVVFARGDIHVALLIDVKIRGAPTVDVV